jgi:hypothetical protein
VNIGGIFIFHSSLGERGLHHLRQLAGLEQLDGDIGASHQLAVEVDLEKRKWMRWKRGSG